MGTIDKFGQRRIVNDKVNCGIKKTSNGNHG